MMERLMPSITIDERVMPEIKDWKVGEQYKIEVIVEQVSLEKTEDYMMMEPGVEAEETMIARFKVKKIKGVKAKQSEKVSEDDMAAGLHGDMPEDY